MADETSSLLTPLVVLGSVVAGLVALVKSFGTQSHTTNAQLLTMLNGIQAQQAEDKRILIAQAEDIGKLKGKVETFEKSDERYRAVVDKLSRRAAELEAALKLMTGERDSLKEQLELTKARLNAMRDALRESQAGTPDALEPDEDDQAAPEDLAEPTEPADPPSPNREQP